MSFFLDGLQTCIRLSVRQVRKLPHDDLHLWRRTQKAVFVGNLHTQVLPLGLSRIGRGILLSLLWKSSAHPDSEGICLPLGPSSIFLASGSRRIHWLLRCNAWNMHLRSILSVGHIAMPGVRRLPNPSVSVPLAQLQTHSCTVKRLSHEERDNKQSGPMSACAMEIGSTKELIHI